MKDSIDSIIKPEDKMWGILTSGWTGSFVQDFGNISSPILITTSIKQSTPKRLRRFCRSMDCLAKNI